MYLRVPATNSRSSFFYILLFSNFKAAEMCKNGFLGLKIAVFFQKSPILPISAAVKSEKSKISKNGLLEFVAETQRYIYTHFLTNWSIFHGLDTISVKKKFLTFCRVSEKMAFFLAKNCQKFSKFWK